MLVHSHVASAHIKVVSGFCLDAVFPRLVNPAGRLAPSRSMRGKWETRIAQYWNLIGCRYALAKCRDLGRDGQSSQLRRRKTCRRPEHRDFSWAQKRIESQTYVCFWSRDIGSRSIELTQVESLRPIHIVSGYTVNVLGVSIYVMLRRVVRCVP